MGETGGRFLRERVGEEPLARGVAFVIWGCRGGDHLAVNISDMKVLRGVKEHEPNTFRNQMDLRRECTYVPLPLAKASSNPPSITP